LTRKTYTQRQNQKLMQDMPRHVAGAFLAMAVGGMAVVAGLFATSAEIIVVGDAAEAPSVTRVG